MAQKVTAGASEILKDKLDLPKEHIGYIQRVERQNQERVNKLLQVKRKNRWTLAALAGLVTSIYFYSIFSVKQEKFMDEVYDENAK